MTQHQSLAPATDYETVRAAIAYLSETPAESVDLPQFARALGMTERQLVELFRRWCGLSPKSFAQAVALDHAKRLLAERASVTCSLPTRRCRPGCGGPGARGSRWSGAPRRRLSARRC